ncbi:D-alanine--D-alanine ligase [Synechococcus sp. CS-1325]|uniref:D-alanine--D-alanine ligase family protein n=1 Tax=Synechococcus sp. CS-1325 TaxID=2847979 RepID=UPI000DB36D09|nr:D-alanine--D-alanine ligase family protein [Synechococcus sp. CS-1325]MCT0198737.1 D-alanine--D-alanine ligase [Synechococcus sp. CS-1325]PZU96294.1 MAG: D-alanine--D-alanine ligase [Cyanobium sp.]
MPIAPRCLGLVFGGASGEHAVSIRSAMTVAGALRRGANLERYRLRCFYIDEQGHWWPPAVAEAVLLKGLPATAAELPGLPGRAGFQALPEGASEVEVWFPVLHGPNGEDGTIQGLFSLMQVPFVGSGVLGSAVGMDKQAMKAAFAAAGLPQVPYAAVQSDELDADPESLLDRLEQQLGYPCFVKPANLGSSVGISKATDRATLLAGLGQAAAFDPRLVVEQGVKARELECAVRTLGSVPSGPLQASVVGEIRFEADWYDYETKYTEGLSSTEIPARLPEPVSAELRRLAILACQAVAASGLARVDFFYDETNGTIWLNEINTLPGFTRQSMFPMLWQASGVSLEDLVHQLIVAAGEAPEQRHGLRLVP